jgi:hypothetical protein
MKIIKIYNFNQKRGSWSDLLIAKKIEPSYANGVLEFLNKTFGCGEHHFKLVEDGYKLYKFKQPKERRAACRL